MAERDIAGNCVVFKAFFRATTATVHGRSVVLWIISELRQPGAEAAALADRIEAMLY